MNIVEHVSLLHAGESSGHMPGNTNQNNPEISPYTNQKGEVKTLKRLEVLVRM